jgi:uncharacterized repeat protein (TIGR03806 family)
VNFPPSIFITTLFLIIFCISSLFSSPIDYAKPTLSEFGFFKEPLKIQHPTKGVIPFSVASPLFSNYAEKLRFIKIPNGEKLTHNADGSFNYPEGSVLIKTFYYPDNFNKPEKERRIIETRLLIKTESDWVALPYVWNEAQTDAYLEVAGDRLPVNWVDKNNDYIEIEYSVPNMNQCKGCHVHFNEFKPLGPQLKNLNFIYNYAEAPSNQINKWVELGILESSESFSNLPQSIDYTNPDTGSLDERARSWLDVNCANCHQLGGPAQTSGLFLRFDQMNSKALGIMKPPIAAGRGSGIYKYTIVPGYPEESIMVYRINSTDPGIMMPELGRKLIHKEGLALIRQWIKEMKP